MFRKLTVLYVLFACVQLGYASFIRMQAVAVADVSDNQVTVRVVTMNSGDEKAVNVKLEAMFPESEPQFSPVKKVLKPGETVENEFKWLISHRMSYRQLVVPIRIHYSDANLYEFSSLEHAKVSVGKKPAVTTVLGKGTTADVNKNGRLSYIFKSLDGKAHSIKARLILPSDLDLITEEVSIAVPASGDVSTEFVLRNKTGLPGSNYAVLALVSEVTPDGLVEDVAVGSVSIVKGNSTVSNVLKKAPIAIAILLVLGFVIMQFAQPGKKKSENRDQTAEIRCQRLGRRAEAQSPAKPRRA